MIPSALQCGAVKIGQRCWGEGGRGGGGWGEESRDEFKIGSEMRTKLAGFARVQLTFYDDMFQFDFSPPV